MTKREEKVSQRGKCGAAEGTRPIAEGVKEPDKVWGGWGGWYYQEMTAKRNKDGACGQKDDKEGGG